MSFLFMYRIVLYNKLIVYICSVINNKLIFRNYDISICKRLRKIQKAGIITETTTQYIMTVRVGNGWL